MKSIATAGLVCVLAGCTTIASADILGNPGEQVGAKNLFVGIEATSIVKTYDIDTANLETTSERMALKVTTGLTDWFDLYVKAGGANLKMDYGKQSNAIKNFDSDFSFGAGIGARMRLVEFVDSGVTVFAQGGAFLFKASDDIQWYNDDGSTLSRERDISWADMQIGLGMTKRMDYISLNAGVGVSEAWWEIDDVDVTRSGSTVSKVPYDTRNSFELNKPIFGFVGIDFILPLEYRISAQTSIRSMDEAEFTIAISQGLEK